MDSEDRSDACRRAGLRDRCRHPPRRTRPGGRDGAGGCCCGAEADRRGWRGYREALRFAEQLRGGRRAWAIEGTRQLRRRPGPLSERAAAKPCSRSAARRAPSGGCAGKDDSLDAARTARAALASETLALPRAGQQREALRLLLIARRSAVDVRRDALVQLRSVIVTAPESLRDELRRLPLGQLLDRCSRLRRTSAPQPIELAVRLVLRSLARRIQARPARSRRARARDPRPRPRARARTARRARSRTDRRRPADRRLVTPRPRSAPKPASPASPASHRSPPPAARPRGTGSAAAATANSTAPCTRSSSTAANTTQPPATTSPDASPKAKSTRDATRLLKRYLARHLYRLLEQQPLMT